LAYVRSGPSAPGPAVAETAVDATVVAETVVVAPEASIGDKKENSSRPDITAAAGRRCLM
jgi:hypothetical protein